MTRDELKILQNLPLEIKILKTKLRIQEWVSYWGENNVYISFSGGKDSTVLLDLVREDFPNVLAVYVDTGLEYPSVKKFVQNFDNVKIIRPKMSFKEVINKYGYPVLGKEAAGRIYYARRALRLGDKQKYERYALGLRKDKNGENYYYNPAKLSKLGMKLLESDIPISDQCCNVMKKNPVKKFEKEFDMHPFIATMTEESLMRETEYLKRPNGCNAFTGVERPTSLPLSFWKEQDILKYIYQKNLSIAPPYGEVILLPNGRFKTTGVDRTGCCYCMFGVHKEKEPNRFQKLKEIEPKIWEYCMKPIEEGGLNLQYILDFMEVPSGQEEKNELDK